MKQLLHLTFLIIVSAISLSAAGSLDTIEPALLSAFGSLKPDSSEAKSPIEKLIPGFELKLKVFEADATNNEASLGFSYKFGKEGSVDQQSLTDESKSKSTVAYGYKAEGNVAFDATRNPADFLKTSAHLSWAKNTMFIDGVSPESMSKAIREALNALAKDDSEGSLRDSPAFWEVQRLARNGIHDQLYLRAGSSVALESNQRFTKRNWTYGAQVGLDFKAYRFESSRARWNIFDYPFAVARLLTGLDKQLAPDGAAFPTILLGYDRVKTDKDPDRKALDVNMDYDRASGEIGFRTAIARVKGEIAYFQANYRLYQEISAPDKVKAKGLDRAEYVALAITLPKGLFVSYTTGQLPFNLKKDQVYSVGFSYDLGK